VTSREWGGVMDFDEYQEQAKRTVITPERDAFIYGLISEMGEIFSAYKKVIREGKGRKDIPPVIRNDLKEQIGDTLWYLSSIASAVDIRLDEVAQENLLKTNALFGSREYKLFDDDEIESERLPRIFEIAISLDGNKVSMKMNNDQYIGDPIDSNSHSEDDYRYHDVFHIAYLAVLGWSPVLRALMKRKRKSGTPDIDRVEDGARAIILEEAVSALVFEQNKELGPFSIKTNIPIQMIVMIKQMTAGLEVSSRNVQDWQRAISLGYRLFDEIKQRRSGTLRVSMISREVDFVD
jgi:NTP pyrophosphatase (non-canonical NTP hydrolase)